GSFVGSQLGVSPPPTPIPEPSPDAPLPSIPQDVGRLGRLSNFMPPLANETLVPKGQLPRQLNVREQKEWALLDLAAKKQKALQDAIANDRAQTIQPTPYEPWPINRIIPAASPMLRAGAREIGDVVAGAPAYVANKMNVIPRTIGNLISPGLGNTIAPNFNQ